MSEQVEVARRSPLDQGVHEQGSRRLATATALLFLISVAKILSDAEVVMEVNLTGLMAAVLSQP